MIVRRHLLVGVVSLLVILFLWGPLVNAAINSFNKDILLAHWKGATLSWYRAAVGDGLVKSGLVQTLIIAVSTTAVSLILAVSGALWWRRARLYRKA